MQERISNCANFAPIASCVLCVLSSSVLVNVAVQLGSFRLHPAEHKTRNQIAQASRASKPQVESIERQNRAFNCKLPEWQSSASLRSGIQISSTQRDSYASHPSPALLGRSRILLRMNHSASPLVSSCTTFEPSVPSAEAAHLLTSRTGDTKGTCDSGPKTGG